MQIIPINDTPSQTIPSVLLGGQNCQFNLYQKLGSLYCDVFVNNAPIVTGVVCQNLNRIVRDLYLGFIGDVLFVDTTSAGSDPSSPGLGTRFVFCYLTPSDLQGAG
jgi:hypothetical protein